MINKFDMQQDIERVLVSEEDIHARIREVGAQISEDYRGKCPILVGVLKGVVPFFGEMSQAITIPVQEDFMCVTSFEGGTASTGKLTFRKDIDHDIEGRDVLILEDIIDSGSTLKLIVELSRQESPLPSRSARFWISPRVVRSIWSRTTPASRFRQRSSSASVWIMRTTTAICPTSAF